MHVAILTQYYPPEIGAPQARLSELAAHLIAAGHEVTVLTAMPNYPTGKIQAGYRGLLRRHEQDGARVIRTFIYPTQRADFVHRLLNYFSFVFSSALLGSFLLKRPDYLLVESPPLFLGLTGFWLSRLKRARLIFNVSDLWPESAVRLGVVRAGSLAYRLSAWLERFCYRRAWCVTGQSQSILADITRRFPDCQTFSLSNGVDTALFSPAHASELPRQIMADGAACVAFYAGLHGLAQGLDQILQAAERLQDDAGLRFVLIGDGPEKQALQQQAQATGLDNILFYDPLPKWKIPPLVASADIVLVPLKLHLPGAVPSKLYEAMASARPVVLVADGEAAHIVRAHEAGFVVEPGDIAGIVSAIQTLRQQPALRQRLGANGRRAAETCFDRIEIATRFISFLEEHSP